MPCPNDDCILVLQLHAGDEHSVRYGDSFAPEVYRICSSFCRGFYSVAYIFDIYHVSLLYKDIHLSRTLQGLSLSLFLSYVS